MNNEDFLTALELQKFNEELDIQEKLYEPRNVYEYTIQRLHYIFNEFEQIVISFSGGKDSGVLLNLAVDYATKANQLHKLSIYHMDYEAQYQTTTDYVQNTLDNLPNEIKIYHVCMPIKAKCAVSMFHSYWRPWDIKDKEIWVRNLPKNTIHIENHNFDFWNENLDDYEFNKKFANWLKKIYQTKIAFLIGIRTDESLNRWRAINRQDVSRYHDLNYSVKLHENCYNFYPIYDWSVTDIWVANAKFNWEYNRIYDLFYYAGLSINQMRVASPFHDCAIDSLKLYKIIEPHTWGKMVSRINGVNFASIYGGTTAMGWKNITKPKHFTWQEYLKFLLNTLPIETKEKYLQKFQTSINFWLEKGGTLPQNIIDDLQKCNIDIINHGQVSKQSDNDLIIFKDYPDEVDIKNFQLVPSYKRMCICIMKNDVYCKYMGFAQTKQELIKRKNAIEKYQNLL